MATSMPQDPSGCPAGQSMPSRCTPPWTVPAYSHRPSGLATSDSTARFWRPPETLTQVRPPSVLRSTPRPPFTSPLAEYDEVAAYHVFGRDGIATMSVTRIDSPPEFASLNVAPSSVLSTIRSPPATT